MNFINNTENIILTIFVYSGLLISSLFLILFIIILYIYYFINYSKIDNDYFIEPLLYELVDKYGLTRKWINIDGKKVFIVERKGNSIPLIFVHGTYSASPIFYELLTLIPDKYHCITIDLPNFGISDDLPVDNEKLGIIFDKYSNFLIKVIDELGYKKINLLGHSLGAIFGLYLGKKRPDLINELFLMSIPGLCRSSGRLGYYNGLIFKYLLPPKLCRFSLLKNLYKPLMYFFRDKDIFIRFWALYTFKTGLGNDIIGKCICPLWTEGYWKKPLLFKILYLKCKTHIWVGANDFFIDPYEDIFSKISPHISFIKFDNAYHNIFLNNNDFINKLVEIMENNKKIVVKNGLKESKKNKLIRFLWNKNVTKSYPSIRQTEQAIKKNYQIIGKMMKN